MLLCLPKYDNEEKRVTLCLLLKKLDDSFRDFPNWESCKELKLKLLGLDYSYNNLYYQYYLSYLPFYILDDLNIVSQNFESKIKEQKDHMILEYGKEVLNISLSLISPFDERHEYELNKIIEREHPVEKDYISDRDKFIIYFQNLKRKDKINSEDSKFIIDRLASLFGLRNTGVTKVLTDEYF